MNIIDSSLWIEFLAGTLLDPKILSVIRNKDELCVPVICLYEVRRKFLNDNDSSKADLSVSIMKNGKIINVDSAIAVLASDVGKRHRLPMADSIIYATALTYNADIYTQDSHFDGLERVRYFAKI